MQEGSSSPRNDSAQASDGVKVRGSISQYPGQRGKSETPGAQSNGTPSPGGGPASNSASAAAASKKEFVTNQYTRIRAGFVSYVIDETTADYDYIKGMFTEDEIKEAFDTIDYNKDQHITADDLHFFLEYIGEKVEDDEIEEMIKMCDIDGNGDVCYEEFQKLASGLSLAPIGQAYPPTQQMRRKQELLQKIVENENEEELFKTLQKSKRGDGQITGDDRKSALQQSQLRQSQVVAGNLVGGDKQSTMTTKEFKVKGKNQSGVAALAAEAPTVLSKTLKPQQKSLQQVLAQRKRLVVQFAQKQKVTVEGHILPWTQAAKQLPNDFVDYDAFLRVMGLEDVLSLKELHLNLIEHSYEPGHCSFKDFLIMLIGAQEQLSSVEKFQLAFGVLGDKKIMIEDLIRITEVIAFKLEVQRQKIEDKVKAKQQQAQTHYREKRLRPDEVDMEIFTELVSSYPTIFTA